MAQRLATKEDLYKLVPQLKGLEPEQACLVDVYLEIAGSMINVKVWKAKASNGHSLLTAHLLAMNPDTNIRKGAPVSSVKVGPVSKSFAVTASQDSELGTTSYGSQYLLLRRTIRRTPLAVGRGIDQF